MRVRCLANRGSELPPDCLDPPSGFRGDTVFDLVVGKEYVVYALTLFKGYIWYYLWDEAAVCHPRMNPSPLFEVADGRLSRYWRFAYRPATGRGPEIAEICFPEWADDPYYLDRLTDWLRADVAIFERYKALMDLEFPDESVQAVADDLGDRWLMCPACQESWEEPSRAGMVRCPGCKAEIRNPYYREDPG